jgi:hypothetical protein
MYIVGRSITQRRILGLQRDIVIQNSKKKCRRDCEGRERGNTLGQTAENTSGGRALGDFVPGSSADKRRGVSAFGNVLTRWGDKAGGDLGGDLGRDQVAELGGDLMADLGG